MAKIGRNDPCPCGSGKKYKKCCLGTPVKIALPIGEPTLPVAPDWSDDEPDLNAYAAFKFFERSQEFARLRRLEPKKAQRFWTTDKVARLGADTIVARLSKLGIDASRQAYVASAEGKTSAWTVGDQWMESGAHPPDRFSADFVYLAACELWKHYVPERPSVEMLDDWIQAGYDHMMSGQATEACDRWWQAWTIIRARLEPHMTTTDDARIVFDGLQSLFNWVQDFAIELGNASIDDTQYAEHGVQLCEQILSQFAEEPTPLFLINFQADLGEFHFRAGRPGDGERILRKLIAEKPEMSIGYPRLADQLAYPPARAGRPPDVDRAIALLEQALRRPVTDAEDYDLHIRLADLKNAAETSTTADTEVATRTPQP